MGNVLGNILAVYFVNSQRWKNAISASSFNRLVYLAIFLYNNKNDIITLLPMSECLCCCAKILSRNLQPVFAHPVYMFVLTFLTETLLE